MHKVNKLISTFNNYMSMHGILNTNISPINDPESYERALTTIEQSFINIKDFKGDKKVYERFMKEIT